MEASDSTAREEGLLAIHYVIGDQIAIVFSKGEIERMEVENARGTHLEPVARQRRVEEPTGGATPPGSGGASVPLLAGEPPSGTAGVRPPGSGGASAPAHSGATPPCIDGGGRR
jgi:hypothetical protein